eukprot:TRINITY_DN7486_c0_g1_i1.p1 TRINITY_DN7486_c0_g1~~TRINITY_DN7486_c0_g1_i1.p1  ORF type:complete len:152 (-),score=27.18 TRINITY_DN7486_c0_g1_i1:72-527(-)
MFNKNSYPTNVILFSIFSIMQGVSLHSLTMYINPQLMIQAAITTIVVFLSTTSYAWTAKKDFSKWGQSLTSCLIILIVGGLFQIFFPVPMLDFVLTCFGVVVFTLFIIFDTWRIMTQFSEDDYVIAAITLYLDLLNLFLEILKLLSKHNKE